MTVKLFQDVAGTIPAILAGQPVGFIKRVKGSDDAKQATALSKPTYARHPWTGVRNLAMGAQGVNLTSFWPASRLQNNVTVDKISSGVDVVDGIPYVEVRVHGTSTSTFVDGVYTSSNSTIDVLIPEELVHSRVQFKHISGEIIPGLQFANPIVGLNAEGGYIAQRNLTKAIVADGNWHVLENVALVPAGAVRARFAVVVNFPTGANVDVTLRIKGLQSGRGTVAPFQFNYGPNDITEPGVADLWHLYNDGSDSLNVTLPAGTYGLASIGIDRQIIGTTFVSDGTTPVNILRHERQLNVSYRLGAYSAAEELAIRDYWGRKYA